MVKKILNIFNLLSFDVATGAIINHLVFCKLIGVSNYFSAIILGTSTCIIYILDRFIDLNQNPQINTERHLFHAKNKQLLSIFVFFLISLNILLLFVLPLTVIYFGIFLAFLTTFYAWLVFRFPKYHKYHKEVFVTFIYTLGVIGTAFVQKKTSINFSEISLAINFFIVTGEALLIFSYYELLEFPKTQNMVLWIGKKNSKILLTLLFLIVILSNFFLSGFAQNVGIIETLMAGLLFGMLFLTKKLQPNQLYRPIGESVFSLPLLLLLF